MSTTLGSFYGAQTLRLQKMFAELPTRVQARVMKALMAESSRTVADAVRSEAPRRTGLMAAAIGASTTRTYGSAKSTKLFVAVGVRRGWRRTVAPKARGGTKFIRGSRPDRGDEGAANPSLYLHLVTKGRKAVTATSAKALFDHLSGKFLGRSVPEAKGNDFVQRAYQEVGPSVASRATERGEEMILAEAGSLIKS